jgi:hypothetical protein
MNMTIRLYSLRRLYPSISQVLLGMSFSKVIDIPGVKFFGSQRSRSLRSLSARALGKASSLLPRTHGLFYYFLSPEKAK